MGRSSDQEITLRTIAALKPGEIAWDAKVSGFYCRCQAKAKVYGLKYRTMDGRQRWATIGRHGSPWTPVTARKEAERLLGGIRDGQDPSGEKQALRATPLVGKTVAEIGAAFIKRYASTETRSWKETQRVLNKDVLSQLGELPMADVSRAMVSEALDRISDRGAPYSARNAFKVIRQLFRWAHGRGIIEANPIAGMTPPVKEQARDRVLTDDEIRILWEAWELDESPFAAACRVLLLTGQRVREVGDMRWSELDNEGNWTIPAERYKIGITHLVPLPAQALDIIKARPRLANSDLVFTVSGKPLNGWRQAKDRMDKLSGVTGWQFRDLRRTARTLMTKNGVDFFIAERTIGHVIKGVAGVYDRHGYLAEKRRALEILASAIGRILNPSQADVLPLRKA